jgi:Ino eighty subunit 2
MLTRATQKQMETINKLLKKQAPKTNRRAALAGDETPDGAGGKKADPVTYRWVQDAKGSRLHLPQELLTGHHGGMFEGKGSFAKGTSLPPGVLIQEVP